MTEEQKKPTAYRVYPAILMPLILTACAIAEAFASTPWALLAIPFIYVGSVCAAPNMNLADGFLAWVAVLAGFIVLHFRHDAGEAIIAGSFLGWFLSSVEKMARAKPIP